MFALDCRPYCVMGQVDFTSLGPIVSDVSFRRCNAKREDYVRAMLFKTSDDHYQKLLQIVKSRDMRIVDCEPTVSCCMF